jgi:hypothetical protein
MNRAQRRRMARQQKRSNRMVQKTENIPMQIQYGHTDTNVVIQFSQPVTNLTPTIEQARAMCAAIENSVKLLEEHQAQLKQGKTQ